MGGFEVSFLEEMDPSVKYHSVKIYILTCTAKTYENTIWWVVLVGRYPPKK